MKRSYYIKWQKKEKYRNPIVRESNITLSNPTGEVAKDAKTALNLFSKSFGSLKYNDILCIKEFGENGKQIGADITPSNEENAIIPISK